MTWVRVRLTVPAPEQEVTIALLSDMPFSVFEEGEDVLDAYLPEAEWTAECRAELDTHPFKNWQALEWEVLPDENWNIQWESHFDPVDLAPFCVVRATFHQPRPEVEHDLVIQPEMAFGTGHHATTRMMLEGMQRLSFSGLRVLDFGAGTALLAILAARMGAAHADAVEIEGPACESAQSNVQRNGVADLVRIWLGTLEVLPPSQYDVVLANINRNVILDHLDTLDTYMAPGAIAGLSGFLHADGPVIAARAEALGWHLMYQTQHLDWLAQWWQKP